ncbi:hypothetical protein AQUCO_01400881v1 [Aquilegia coerulea]|uniref:Uncharacterized protein n=1 Tax=Aquilegia coerulea TaxID=218851 RepID=A0A2G5DYJ5_AQUCA|nr:hypothetical protein AQUCO_01400881v1 [Aquilegia coerulea]
MENELGFAPTTINEIVPPNSRGIFRFAHQPALDGGQSRRFSPYSYSRRAGAITTSRRSQGFERYPRRQYRRRSTTFTDQRPQVHSTHQSVTVSSIRNISNTMLESRIMTDYYFNVMQLVAHVVHNGLDMLAYMCLHGTNGMEPTHMCHYFHEMLIMQEATMAGVNYNMSIYQNALGRYMSLYPRVALTTQRILELGYPWGMTSPNMEPERSPPALLTSMVHEQQHPPASTRASNFIDNISVRTTGEELAHVPGPANFFTDNRSAGTTREELDLTLRL